ncbi:kinase-like domain-containing protein [Tirmania nivea]|nr:kinase-like domain-containing protein [Tirmania nivea]
MEGSIHEDDYSEVTDSAQEDCGVEGIEGNEEEGKEDDEEEQQSAQYHTRGVDTQADYCEGVQREENEGEEEEEEEEGHYDDDEEEDWHYDDEDHDSVVSAYSEDQSDSEEDVDDAVREEMDSFCRHFKGIDRRFRLISKIGEGTFSSVYKAEDLLYDRYENDWDLDASDDDGDRSPPPNKRRKFAETQRRCPKYVAIKKIYVTSSPQRIMNELELLHELRGCRDVVPLITAFRHLDQVVAILPYFKHVDFRNYFRALSFDDMQLYFKSLFNALSHVHRCKIIHRDIKPTNFLYDYSRRRGVLVDFGLAEREGTDWSHCPCQHSGLSKSHNSLTQPSTLSAGYIKNDNRPSRRANRAGTRGFRAPEVLFKCTSQTTKIDIWSAGVVLLTMLSKRFPFFNSADDVDATIEIATIFGKARMRSCALLHGAVFESNIPTIGEKGFTLEKIIMWATNRIAGGGGKEREKDELREANMTAAEKVACEFLARCLELDPAKRIDADEALEHEFLRKV